MSNLSTEPEPSGSSPPLAENVLLSSKTAGVVFLTGAAVLIMVLVYMVLWVISPMTKPPQFTEQLLQAAAENIKENESTEYSYMIDYLVSLEYTAASIRTVGVQIAVASIGGFFLVVVGVILFSLGILKPFSVQATAPGYGMDWKDGSPGLFCAMLGMILLGMGVLRPSFESKDISYKRECSSGQSEERTLGIEGGTGEFDQSIDSKTVPGGSPKQSSGSQEHDI